MVPSGCLLSGFMELEPSKPVSLNGLNLPNCSQCGSPPVGDCAISFQSSPGDIFFPLLFRDWEGGREAGEVERENHQGETH